MKGSSLHRAGLTREKMSLLASFLGQNDKKQTVRTQTNNNYKAAKNHELDILWGGVKSGIQKVHNATKTSSQKSPAVYLIIGFIAGVVFMLLITFIVSVSAMAPKTVEQIENNNKAATSIVAPGEDDATISDSAETVVVVEQPLSQEKYIVKQGDTLNGIAYRFYGKYDEAKLKEIQRINNLVNPEALKIDQELMIPIYQER